MIYSNECIFYMYLYKALVTQKYSWIQLKYCNKRILIQRYRRMLLLQFSSFIRVCWRRNRRWYREVGNKNFTFSHSQKMNLDSKCSFARSDKEEKDWEESRSLTCSSRGARKRIPTISMQQWEKKTIPNEWILKGLESGPQKESGIFKGTYQRSAQNLWSLVRCQW